MPENRLWRETLRDFMRSVSTEDDTGMVIRAHLYFEQLLGWGLEQRLDKPEAVLGGQGVTYNQKLRLCYALSIIDDECYGFLRALGKIRNSFGHDLGRQLTEDDIVALVSPLRKELRNQFEVMQTGIQAEGVPMDFPRAKMTAVLMGMMPFMAFGFFEDKEHYVEEIVAFHQQLRDDWNDGRDI